MRLSPRFALTCALVTLVTLSGCSGTPAPVPSPTVTLPSPAPTQEDSLPPVPPEDVEIATAAAVAGLEAFVDTDQPEDDWWTALEPLLSDDAAYRFEGTDPTLVPASEVTGDPDVLSTEGWTISVQIPTDVGNYVVDVVQEESDVVPGAWLVNYFHPPQDLS